MDENLKNELISSLSKNYGYEKAVEIIEATEYVNYLDDERINTIMEFFYVSNNDLILENTLLKNEIKLLTSFIEKKNFNIIKFISFWLLTILSGLIFFLISKI